MNKGLFIGELARRAGVPVSTVRYYERNGLLEEPERRDSGYRAYSLSAVERLRFIRQAQEVGFTLKQIRLLIRLQGDPAARSTDVRHEVQISLDRIRSKLATLASMEMSMSRLLACCCNDDRPVDQCPILIQLYS